MNEDRLIELARGLLERTEQGKAKWTPATEGDTTAFRCDLQSGFVVIRSRDGDNSPPYWFMVYPPEGGSPLETLTTDLARPATAGDRNRILGELYDIARNKALGIADRLDRLLEEVGVKTPEDDIPF
jgi:hypothetical protein